jgi:hypothetical protein
MDAFGVRPRQSRAMPDSIYKVEGVRVMECAAERIGLHGVRGGVDLIGEARGHGADLVVIPAECLGDDFFRLRTGIAGEVIQKFVTYQVRLAILGDISRHVNDSSALRDFVREANEGSHCWFVTNREEMRKLLVLRS